MFQKSETIEKLAVALLKAQKEIGKAAKTATNPFFKSSYADLGAIIEAIKEPLNNQGIAFLQAIGVEDSQPIVETILLHDSGQFISSRTPVLCAKPNDPQAFGSGVTYSKRYALQAMLGLPTTDDDGEKAMARSEKPAPKPNPSSRSLPPTEQPEIPKASLDLITQANFNYETEHANDVAAGFYIDPVAFKDAVWKKFGKWPTTKASVPKIVAAIELKDVLKEDK